MDDIGSLYGAFSVAVVGFPGRKPVRNCVSSIARRHAGLIRTEEILSARGYGPQCVCPFGIRQDSWEGVQLNSGNSLSNFSSLVECTTTKD
jgi:hypothetical protein